MRFVAPVWSFGPHGEGGTRVLQSVCAKARDAEARMMMADAATAGRNLMPLLLSPVKGTARHACGRCPTADSVPFTFATSRARQAGSALPEIGVLAREHVLAGRREHVDDLGVLGEVGFVRGVPGDHPAVPGPAGSLLTAEVELHTPRERAKQLILR